MKTIFNHPCLKMLKEGIIKGMYLLKPGENGRLKVQLLASGSMVNEIIEASKLLKSDWGIDSDIWSVTSFSELHREAEDKKRWNTLHPDEKDKPSLCWFPPKIRKTVRSLQFQTM